MKTILYKSMGPPDIINNFSYSRRNRHFYFVVDGQTNFPHSLLTTPRNVISIAQRWGNQGIMVFGPDKPNNTAYWLVGHTQVSIYKLNTRARGTLTRSDFPGGGFYKRGSRVVDHHGHIVRAHKLCDGEQPSWFVEVSLELLFNPANNVN